MLVLVSRLTTEHTEYQLASCHEPDNSGCLVADLLCLAHLSLIIGFDICFLRCVLLAELLQIMTVTWKIMFLHTNK